MEIDEALALVTAPPERDPYRLYLSDEYPDPENLLAFGDSGTLPMGEITAIAGKAKTGKSFAVSILVASILGCKEFGFITTRESGKVLYFDTEQGDSYVARVIRRIHRLLGWNVREDNPRLIPYKLREMALEERFPFILEKVMEYAPVLIVIDGIADLVFDFNDVRESTEKVVKLLDMCSRCNVAILTVLHENKGKEDRNMKGHLGTMLLRKCASVFHLEKHGNEYNVVNTDCRNRPIDDWAFVIGEDGLPRTTENLQASREADKEAKEIDKLKFMVANVFTPSEDRFTYSELKRKIMAVMGVSARTAEYRIKDATEAKIISLSGGIYSLPEPTPEHPPQ